MISTRPWPALLILLLEETCLYVVFPPISLGRAFYFSVVLFTNSVALAFLFVLMLMVSGQSEECFRFCIVICRGAPILFLCCQYEIAIDLLNID